MSTAGMLFCKGCKKTAKKIYVCSNGDKYCRKCRDKLDDALLLDIPRYWGDRRSLEEKK